MAIAKVFVLLWFLLAFAFSITGWFERLSAPALFRVGAGIAIIGFSALYWLSTRFREFTRTCGLKRVTQVQLFRFFGILALIETHRHFLPPIFGISTGVLDITFATTSVFAAKHLVTSEGGPRPAFFAWHILGVLSLSVAVTLAILTSSARFGLVEDGITSQSMTWFPMSLVPTFFGPLVLACHLLALVNARAYYGRHSPSPDR